MFSVTSRSGHVFELNLQTPRESLCDKLTLFSEVVALVPISCTAPVDKSLALLLALEQVKTVVVVHGLFPNLPLGLSLTEMRYK